MPYGTYDRSAEPDLGLSPLDLVRLEVDFPAALRGLTQEGALPRGIWHEVGNVLGKRNGIGDMPPNVLRVPDFAPIWKRTALDRSLQKRSGAIVGTTTTGGYLVETENLSWISLLRNRAICFQMGARLLSGLVANVAIPRQSGATTAYWLSTESTTVQESDWALQQVPLTPRTVGSYTTISRLLQLQSSPDATSLLMQDLAAQVALAVDAAAIAGTGTEQPQGIIGTTGVGTFSGSSLALAALLDAQTDVANANALTSTCGYVFTPATAGLLMARQRFSGATASPPLWEGGMLDGTILGCRSMASNQCPSGKGVFGDWSQLLIGSWNVLELAVNPTANFPAGISGLRAMWTVDCALRVPAAFSTTSSIT